MPVKKRKPRTTSVTEQASPLQQAAEALFAIPEIAEAFASRADLELVLDDRGWLRFNDPKHNMELRETKRQYVVERARAYWHSDPLAKQAVRLWTDYSIGTGMTFKCDDAGKQKTLETFFKLRANRKVTSSEGQRKTSKRMLIDGEAFFAIFDGTTGDETEVVPVLRRVDALQITDFINDPDDDECVIGYRRCYRKGATEVKLYYRDAFAEDEDVAEVEGKPFGDKQENGWKFELGVKLYHAPFDPLYQRGNSLLEASLDWSREHRRFMEARVGLIAALAKYAYKLTVKGGSQQIANAKAKLASSFASGGTVEKNPVPAAASTWLSNAGAEIAPMPRTTGAGDAKEDGDMLKLNFCAGTGIMLHYMGDPSTGNLATATAMELPMLKQFTAYQVQNRDIWLDLFAIVLGVDDAVIDIDYPPIVETDIQETATAFSTMLGAAPELKVDEVLSAMLVALGINNVSDVMNKVVAKAAENKAQADAAAQAATKLATVVGKKPVKTNAVEALTEALHQLIGELSIEIEEVA